MLIFLALGTDTCSVFVFSIVCPLAACASLLLFVLPLWSCIDHQYSFAQLCILQLISLIVFCFEMNAIIFQDFVPRAASQFKTHEEAFFSKIKGSS